MESSNSKSTGIIIVIIVVLAIIGATIWALNSGDDDNSDQAATNQTQQVDETQEQEAAPADIVGLAAGTESLSTLVTAVQAAELVETLQSEGPFTVFAPTNDAFAALPEGTLDTLLAPENQDQLASVLTYHVVEGAVLSSDLSDGQEITTVQGETLTVSIEDGSVSIVDVNGGEATVQQADVTASNGVVHIIDSVLLPQQ